MPEASGGAVTVQGSQTFDTLQFMTDGYTLAGGTLLLGPATGTVNVDGGVTATIGSVIDGAGKSLDKVGTGTLTLTGDNTYTGATTISSGTLSLGNGGTTGSVAGNIVDNTALVFNRSNALTYAGLISGAGTVTKSGAGTLTLTGDNTYTGATTISAGTLSLGNGGTTGSVAGNIVDDAALVFNRSNALTYAGLISGTGTVTKNGAGTLRLTGDSTYTGATTVAGGMLVVDGSIARSSVSVNAGARLAGVGTVGPTTINAGAVVAPGTASNGTLNVNGDLSFSPGSTYEVDIDPALGSDRLHSTGRALIGGGTVSAAKAQGVFAPGSRWMIVAADGGRTGTFDALAQQMPFVNLALSYDATHVYIDSIRNEARFSDFALTVNQHATANDVDSLGVGNSVHNAVAALSDPATVRSALDLLSGELHASAHATLQEESSIVRDAVSDRLRAAFGEPVATLLPVMSYAPNGPELAPADTEGPAAWGQVFGASGETDDDGNAAGVDQSMGGFLVGADAPIGETWRAGFLVGYDRTAMDVEQRASAADVDSVHVGVYGGARWGGFGMNLGAAYAWHDLATTRAVVFPGFDQMLSAEYAAHTAQAFGEASYQFNAGRYLLQPFASLAYASVGSNSFAEAGGAAALLARPNQTDVTYTTIGARGATDVTFGSAEGTLTGMLGWRHAFGDLTPLSTLAFSGGNPFAVLGTPIAGDALTVSAGFDLKVAARAKLGLIYSGQYGDGARESALTGNFNVSF